MWSRERENELVERCVEAARLHSPASCADEADLFRLVAQLVKTRHPAVAAALEHSSTAFFERTPSARPRSFPECVSAGLVQDVSRFRNVLEHRLMGVRSW